jgi:chaperone modulatory protein CbpM
MPTPAETRLRTHAMGISVTARAWLTLDELAEATGISRSSVARLARLGLVPAEGTQPPEFPAAVALRLQRMLRLRRELELDLTSAAMLADLLERMDRLEAELARLRGG